MLLAGEGNGAYYERQGGRPLQHALNQLDFCVPAIQKS
jgi:hypothetical protein